MKKYIVPIICIIIAIGFICYKDFKINNYKKQIIELTEEIEKYKQAANPSKEEIDSLAYNIQYRDSIIYDIKTKYIKDVEVIKTMPDSSVVDMFKELVWSD
jgi:uncharacterized coiled-coil DUF342 family protein